MEFIERLSLAVGIGLTATTMVVGVWNISASNKEIMITVSQSKDLLEKHSEVFKVLQDEQERHTYDIRDLQRSGLSLAYVNGDHIGVKTADGQLLRLVLKDE